MSLGLKISKENTKIGRIANISFPPITSCAPNVPCINNCYALKAWRMYPNARKAWQHNYDCWKDSPHKFQNELELWLFDHKPKVFRWFVAGDIPEWRFLEVMNDIADLNPKTRFLCFTKRHDLSFIGLRKNLQIILSMWPGWGNTNLPGRKAWVQDGTETRTPEDAIECLGACDKCFTCFYLNDLGRDVVFGLH